MLQEHPQQHSLLAALKTFPHEQSPHTRHSDVVSVVHPRFPQPFRELLDTDGGGELVPELPEDVRVVLDFELQPSEEHSQ